MSNNFVQLGSVAEFINGAAFKPEDWGESGLKIIRIQNLTDSNKPFNRTKRVVSDKVRVQKGDLLVSWSATLGVFEWLNEEEALLNQHIFRVLPNKEKVDKRYLRHGLEGAILDMEKHLHGATMKHVNRGEFLSTNLYLPPIAEQKRIAEILDHTQSLISKRKEAIAKLDTLTQSIFLEMFGDTETNPHGWDIQALSNYVAQFQGGKSIESESGENTITKNRILKVSAVTKMVFLPEESKPLSDNYEPAPEHFVRNGDLLFSRANTTELVGAVAYVKETPSNILLPDKLWRFVWKQPAKVLPLFVWSLFQTSVMRREIGKRATGTSGSMKNISQEKLLGIKTIVPPLPLQKEFAQRVEAVEKLKATHRASLSQLEALFASLQHRAFRGEL